MKKIASITLFLLLLVNTAGLYLLFSGLLWKENSLLEARLDDHQVSPEQEMLIKSPINLPYQINWGAYQRINGELTYHGQHYNAYQHKIYQDTMYTIYVKDPVKSQLYQKLNAVISLFACVPPGNTGSAAHSINFLKEYLPVKNTSMAGGNSIIGVLLGNNQKDHFSSLPKDIITPPPEILS